MFRLSLPRTPSPRWPAWILSVLLICLSCVDDTHDMQPVSMRGTVVYLTFEGGFYAIIGEDGSHWDPDNLPGSFAVDSLAVAFHGVPTDHATDHMWGRTMLITHIERIAGAPVVNLKPFRELARNASCADVRNRLFLIDQRLVFWDRESKCADAAYAQTLYDRRPSTVLCNAMDSIAGPQRACNADAPFINMFETVLENLEAPDLGLGPGHTVTPVDF